MAEKVIPAEIPAGHARDEAKRQVADELAEKAETEYQDLSGFDPSKLDIENEIAQHYNEQVNEFEVTDPVPGYTYLWGPCRYIAHTEILGRVARYLGNRVPGFELVNGPRSQFPECWQLKAEDGTRRIGDVQLYRVKTAVYEAMMERQALQAKARDLGVGSNIVALAERYPKYVRATEVRGDPVEYMRERARSHGGIPRDAYDREMIRTLAVHKIAEDAKEGNLYGMPVERAVRKNRK